MASSGLVPHPAPLPDRFCCFGFDKYPPLPKPRIERIGLRIGWYEEVLLPGGFQEIVAQESSPSGIGLLSGDSVLERQLCFGPLEADGVMAGTQPFEERLEIFDRNPVVLVVTPLVIARRIVVGRTGMGFGATEGEQGMSLLDEIGCGHVYTQGSLKCQTKRAVAATLV